VAPARQLIDWHTHCYLPEHMDAGARATMQARGVIGGEASPDDHRRGVVESGAEKFVVIKMPTKSGRGIPNDFIGEYVGRYPGRAVGFAAIDPTERDAAAELERCVTRLRLRGLKLSPVYHGYDPWSPAVWRLYEMADAYRMPVMFHMGGAYDPEAALEWGSPLLLDRVARAFPSLRIIVAHLGQPMMEETVILLRKNEHVFADLSARFHRRWQLYNGLRAAIEYRVTDRLLFGSDFPVMTTHDAATAFRAINDWGDGVRLPPIPPELIDQILHERPLELLGLA
jgi:predicted TIM-barrel fold metal-dependent hydrolase